MTNTLYPQVNEDGENVGCKKRSEGRQQEGGREQPEERERAVKREVRVLELFLSQMTVSHHQDLADITEALTST